MATKATSTNTYSYTPGPLLHKRNQRILSNYSFGHNASNPINMVNLHLYIISTRTHYVNMSTLRIAGMLTPTNRDADQLLIRLVGVNQFTPSSNTVVLDDTVRTHTPAHTHTLQTIVSAPLFFFLHFLLSCNSLVLLRLERVPVLPQAMINVIGAVFLFLLVRSWLAVGELWHKGNTDSLVPSSPQHSHTPSRRLFLDTSRKGPH